MVTMFCMLAQTTAPSGGANQVPGWFEFIHRSGFLLPMLLVFAVWMFVMRSKKPADKQREQLLKEMKRGDRVQTIGGILGTVVDARETEVVVKVDESSNTKIRFARNAIHRVLEDEKAAGSSAAAK